MKKDSGSGKKQKRSKKIHEQEHHSTGNYNDEYSGGEGDEDQPVKKSKTLSRSRTPKTARTKNKNKLLDN
jgi:hypothetical protein